MPLTASGSSDSAGCKLGRDIAGWGWVPNHGTPAFVVSNIHGAGHGGSISVWPISTSSLSIASRSRHLRITVDRFPIHGAGHGSTNFFVIYGSTTRPPGGIYGSTNFPVICGSTTRPPGGKFANDFSRACTGVCVACHHLKRHQAASFSRFQATKFHIMETRGGKEQLHQLN